ncbi:MAG: hypothetical protein GY943_22755, partial [Chloroflexi bacterium]|nr:hypothetical protein [Chloroflexota bacterium]
MKSKLPSLLGFLTLFIFIFLFIAGGRSTAAPQGDTFTYLPIIHGLSVDLTITGMEITQGVQSMNNDVVMVANRPAIARVYAKTIVGNAQSSSVVLSATRGGFSLGSVTVGPKTVPKSTDRGNYSTTFNFTVPASWLSGNVIITATVDQSGLINETNESNNNYSQTVNFNAVPDLRVVVVPINYTHQGSTQPGYYSGNRVDYISDWMMRAFPIDTANVSIRGSNYHFSGNLETGASWGNLLVEIRLLKRLDLGTEYVPTLYYGFIPIANNSQRWWFGGIAGFGYVGDGIRSSIGLNLGNNDTTGELAAHEIGHNLGRPHSPCGGASGPDPNYPYAGGGIGEYGLDGILAGSPSVIKPSTHTDVMGYCDPVWISDYTYEKLYADQVSNGLLLTTAVPTESLLVHGTISEDGQVSLGSVYAFNQYPQPVVADSGYTVELVDANGAVLGTYPANVAIAEEPGIKLQSFMAVIPLADQMPAGIRVMSAETAVAEQSLTTNTANLPNSVNTAQEGNMLTLSWGQPDTPAVVRYTTNDGVSYTTLALNVLGGEYEVDTTALAENGR